MSTNESGIFFLKEKKPEKLKPWISNNQKRHRNPSKQEGIQILNDLEKIVNCKNLN